MNIALSQFKQRFISGIALIAILGVSYWMRPFGLYILIGGLTLGSVYELGRLMTSHLSLTHQVAVVLLTGLAFLSPVVAGALVLSLLYFLRIYHKPYEDSLKTSGKQIVVFASLFTMIFISIGYVLAEVSANHFIPTLGYIAVAILVDSLGYFIGQLSHGVALGWKISPKKTQIGYMGSICITFLILKISNIVSYQSNFVFLGLILFSIAGDLGFSLPKRMYQIKDYSQVLPGHGGFLDRLDSIFGVLFFIQILYSFNKGCFLFPQIM